MRVPLLATACLAFIVACGSATSTTPTPAIPTAEATPSGPAGPPVVQAELSGSASVSGPLHFTDVTCANPTFSGLTIIADATNATPNLAIRLTLSSTAVAVQLDTGSGSSYRERDFAGSGISGFNASTGATVSSPLHDTTAANGKIGSIGSVSSITASVNCKGQTAGSGAFTFTGTTAQGAISSPLTVTRVTCSTLAGPGVYTMHAVGIGTVGTQAALIGVFGNASASGHYASVTLSLQNNPISYFFTSTAAANVTLSTTSARVDARVTEPYAPMDTLHVTGDATCGSSIQTSG